MGADPCHLKFYSRDIIGPLCGKMLLIWSGSVIDAMLKCAVTTSHAAYPNKHNALHPMGHGHTRIFSSSFRVAKILAGGH